MYYVGHYRGSRAGRTRRPEASLRSVGNGVAIIVRNRPGIVSPTVRAESALRHVHVDRHSAPPGADLVFGCLNIRSVANKLEDLLEVRQDQRLDVTFLVETWADSDSVSLRCMRVDGLAGHRPSTAANAFTCQHAGYEPRRHRCCSGA